MIGNVVENTNNLSSLFPGLDDRLRICAELLVAGVAFQQDGKTWSVFSHEGEEIGSMSTYWVSETVCAMKKLGWKVNGFAQAAYGNSPAITLGHTGPNPARMSDSEWEALMKRRHRKVVIIH